MLVRLNVSNVASLSFTANVASDRSNVVLVSSEVSLYL
jgi:hypothetical protein